MFKTTTIGSQTLKQKKKKQKKPIAHQLLSVMDSNRYNNYIMALCSLSPQTVSSEAKLFAYPVLLIKSFGLLQFVAGSWKTSSNSKLSSYFFVSLLYIVWVHSDLVWTQIAYLPPDCLKVKIPVCRAIGISHDGMRFSKAVPSHKRSSMTCQNADFWGWAQDCPIWQWWAYWYDRARFIIPCSEFKSMRLY